MLRCSPSDFNMLSFIHRGCRLGITGILKLSGDELSLHQTAETDLECHPLHSKILSRVISQILQSKHRIQIRHLNLPIEIIIYRSIFRSWDIGRFLLLSLCKWSKSILINIVRWSQVFASTVSIEGLLLSGSIVTCNRSSNQLVWLLPQQRCVPSLSDTLTSAPFVAA